MKVIVFHDENGLDVSDVYHADTEEQLDNAVLSYLSTIDDFAWDENTAKLQEKVKSGDSNGLWKMFRNLNSIGYDCFRLADGVGYAILEVK